MKVPTKDTYLPRSLRDELEDELDEDELDEREEREDFFEREDLLVLLLLLVDPS